MRVRVMLEFLIPGVEHAEEADLGAEMFGITSDLEECFGTGLQQQMVQDFLVVQSERRQLMGQGEDTMNVPRRQKLLAPSFKPTPPIFGSPLHPVPFPAHV